MIDRVLQVHPGQPPIDDIPFIEWLNRSIQLTNNALANIPDGLDYISEFLGVSTDTQDPVGLDTPMKINWGPAFENESLEVTADGDIIIRRSDVYTFEVYLQIYRTKNPGESKLVTHPEINGVPTFTSWAIAIDDRNEFLPLFATLTYPAEKDDVFNVYLTRDSQGEDDGGLASFVPTNPAIPPSFSSRMFIRRIGLA